MKKNGYENTTIKATGKRLRDLERNCNLGNPEQVKGFISTKQCSNAYKESREQPIKKMWLLYWFLGFLGR